MKERRLMLIDLTIAKLVKIDFKYASLLVILLAISCWSYCYWPEIKQGITCMFTKEWIPYLLAGVSATITILHKIKLRKLTFSENMSFETFKIPFEDVFSFISNPVTLVCSYSLARGLFLQCTGQEIYFPRLSGTEIGFITIVIGYLLFLSLWQLIRSFWQLILKQPESVTPQASDKDGHHINLEGEHHKPEDEDHRKDQS
jgi:hypothetical protein